MTPIQWLSAFRRAQVGGQDWPLGLTLALVFGLAVLAYYGWDHGSTSNFVAALLLAGACLVLGVFLGFLFGIPRSLQSDTQPSTVDHNDKQGAEQEKQGVRFQYGANTNLEQISDWLTKILVGVGLTQMNSLGDKFSQLGKYFGVALGTSGEASRIVIIIIVYFSVVGFLFGYLWTRLFLGGELARADLNAVTNQVKEVVEAQEEQGQIDAKALSLVTQYLAMVDISKISIDEMKQAVEQSSPPVKVQVFYQARGVRSVSWQLQDEKWKVERTIPIFEALIDSDKENRFHQNHGQLGYALKDMRNPDYHRAEAELSKAIRIRGPASDAGSEIYELNRAICRINQDSEFNAGRPSNPQSRGMILSDLQVAVIAFPDFLNDADISKWLEINKIQDVLNNSATDENSKPNKKKSR